MFFAMFITDSRFGVAVIIFPIILKDCGERPLNAIPIPIDTFVRSFRNPRLLNIVAIKSMTLTLIGNFNFFKLLIQAKILGPFNFANVLFKFNFPFIVHETNASMHAESRVCTKCENTTSMYPDIIEVVIIDAQYITQELSFDSFVVVVFTICLMKFS